MVHSHSPDTELYIVTVHMQNRYLNFSHTQLTLTDPMLEF